jgi:hypothetical protein
MIAVGDNFFHSFCRSFAVNSGGFSFCFIVVVHLLGMIVMANGGVQDDMHTRR